MSRGGLRGAHAAEEVAAERNDARRRVGSVTSASLPSLLDYLSNQFHRFFLQNSSLQLANSARFIKTHLVLSEVRSP